MHSLYWRKIFKYIGCRFWIILYYMPRRLLLFSRFGRRIFTMFVMSRRNMVKWNWVIIWNTMPKMSSWKAAVHAILSNIWIILYSMSNGYICWWAGYLTMQTLSNWKLFRWNWFYELLRLSCWKIWPRSILQIPVWWFTVCSMWSRQIFRWNSFYCL